jgi:hypothetical protein
MCDGIRKVLYAYDPEVDPPFSVESESEGILGGGMLRCAFNGGSLANRCIRSRPMASALISVNPGLRSPLTEEENEDIRRVACLAWQWGHSVSAILV